MQKGKGALKIFLLLVILAIVFSIFYDGGIIDYFIKSNNAGDSSITGSAVGIHNNPLVKSETPFTAQLDPEITVCPNCNVILIIIDTLRADHVGAYGYDRDTTPNIDKLAEEGIVFKNMVAQSSWTKPSTASILTGLYPINHGANRREDRLIEDHLLLSEILKENGYNTYAFIANPTIGGATGFNQGYDEFLYFKKSGKFPYAEGNEVNGKLIPFIENMGKASKQFIYVHYMDPHHPYAPQEKQFSRSNTGDYTEKFFHDYQVMGGGNVIERNVVGPELINLYDDEILFTDKLIGDVVNALKDKGMYDNSIIIVVSDHGEEFFDHGGTLHGKELYDEQLLVPWIMQLPGAGHRVIGKQVSHIDMLPTILSLLDITSPDDIDGLNVLDSKNEKFEKRKFIYSQLDHRFNLLYSMRSLEKKVIMGSSMVKDLPITWLEDQITLTVKNDRDIEISLIPFPKYQKILLTIDEEFVREKEVVGYGSAARIRSQPNIPRNKSRIIHLKALLPCVKVSDLGRINDSRCLSFGIVTEFPHKRDIGYPDEREIYPIRRYYLPKNDPRERMNLFFLDEYQEDLKPLENKLYNYIKSAKKRTKPSKPVQYTAEQLEALKALGYI